MGWEQLRNGELLDAAARTAFDAMLTTDKNLRHQQNLARLPIGAVELNAARNRLQELGELVPHIPGALERLKRFRFVAVHPDGRFETLAERSDDRDSQH